MKDLVFAMELRGQAAPVAGREGVLQAHTASRGPQGETVSFTSQRTEGVSVLDDTAPRV